MYSPLTVAARGGGVGVGGMGVGLGMDGVGVLWLPKRELQADKPSARIRMMLRKSFLATEVLLNPVLKSIVRIIPIKKLRGGQPVAPQKGGPAVELLGNQGRFINP